jgi:hypothetical protein
LLIAPDRSRRLSRIVAILLEGERLAARVSAAQARLTRCPRMSRALGLQSAQEAEHAALAELLGRALPAPGATSPALVALRTLEYRIEGSLASGDLAGSLLGLQGVVEHLGETVLERLDPNRHGAPFLAPAHRRVLAQERGHVALGARWLAELEAELSEAALAEYVGLGDAVSAGVCEVLDVAPPSQGVEARVRAWIAGAS